MFRDSMPAHTRCRYCVDIIDIKTRCYIATTRVCESISSPLRHLFRDCNVQRFVTFRAHLVLFNSVMLGDRIQTEQYIYSPSMLKLASSAKLMSVFCLKCYITNRQSSSCSPPLVSFQTMPSRLMVVPGSQAPSDSGSVTVPASAVLLAI